MESFVIEFDGQHVEVKTNVEDAANFFRQSYAPVFVAEASKPVGALTVVHHGTGYEILGTNRLLWRNPGIEVLLQHFKKEIHFLFMQARPDLFWLHASAVERDGSAILISGPSGVGKSTIALALCDRGWRLMSDDVAPVDMAENTVLPFFQGAVRRKRSEEPIDPGDVGRLEREAVQLAPESVSTTSAQFRAVVFPRFVHDSIASLFPMPPARAAMELVRNLTNFGDHHDNAISRACEIASEIPAHELQYGTFEQAVDLIQRIL